MDEVRNQLIHAGMFNFQHLFHLDLPRSVIKIHRLQFPHDLTSFPATFIMMATLRPQYERAMHVRNLMPLVSK